MYSYVPQRHICQPAALLSEPQSNADWLKVFYQFSQLSNMKNQQFRHFIINQLIHLCKKNTYDVDPLRDGEFWWRMTYNHLVMIHTLLSVTKKHFFKIF